MLMNVQERIEKENRIVEAKVKAEESERLKSAFLANMSHEIRTPMNGILGFMDLLRSPDLTHENRTNYIDIVTSSGNRLLGTLNDIIEISKIETSEMKVNISNVDTSEMMLYFHNFFRPQAGVKGVKLMLKDHLQGDDAFIMTDRSKLESMISNLLKNATKFTTKGEIEFGNRIDGDRVVFYVKDTGPGVNEANVRRIFERFVQGDMSTTRHFEGSGLGLSIVKAYSDMLDGKVWVESEPGKGSIFYFSLPYIKPGNGQMNKAEFGNNTEKSRDDLTILIVEDDPASYLYLQKVLASEELNIIHTNNGLDAVKIVSENKAINLVLMDIKIPGISGIDATREIRLFNAEVPVIAQTAYAFASDREEAIVAGCNDFISKPINKNDLIKLIRKYTRTESRN